MIKAQLRELHSPDLEELDKNSPADPKKFGLLVQALVGPEGAEGEESFDFMVCTPAWLAEELGDSGYILGRHYLFVAKYDYAQLKKIIEGLCSQANGEDWAAAAAFLSRYGAWEYEDYQ
jgi:hypothetical protein